MTDKKADMILALEATYGVVTDACRRVGISRQTHYRWMTEDEQYKADVEEIADVALDFVEGKLFKNVQEGSDTAIIFYLKTKGKKRGFIEKTEVDQRNTHVINWEEIKTYIKENE